MNRHAVAIALVSAVLFGVSTPAAKALLGQISPTILAGLFCGAGIGIAILRRARSDTTEVRLGRRELPSLRKISAELAGAGHKMVRKYRGSEAPRPFNPATVKAMLEGPMPEASEA